MLFERDEFVLFYQPQFALEDGAMVGAEALIRWNHPLRGLLAPAAFLPALEAGVLAAPVGQWVLETACAQAMAWRDIAPDFRVSVNLFPAQFRSGDLPRQVAETLDKHGLPPSGLELEITENIILTEQGSVLAQLEEVARLGVTLSFDDFGTGVRIAQSAAVFPGELHQNRQELHSAHANLREGSRHCRWYNRYGSKTRSKGGC